jgi:SAM-dependent methyltransferase
MKKPRNEQEEGADILGAAILQHYRENSPCEITLFIDGEEEPPMSSAYFFRSESEMNDAECKALELCQGRVLDVGAGAGCHALILQQRGHEVVALEKSASACEVLRARGVKEVIRADVMHFSDGPFDTILLLMNGFGIGGNEQGLLAMLEHLKTLLAPGGKIIGDSTDIRYFKDEPASLDLSQAHFSEVQFDVRMNGLHECFSWIYPDEVLLEVLAQEAGLQYRTRLHSDEFHFLGELYV